MSSATRDAAPDILRGFALWGIVVVNAGFFAASVDLGVTADALTNWGDSLVAFLVFTLAQGKFYLIFSFLFGYSAHYILRNPVHGRRRWVMRSVGLIVLGIAHAVLLFIGDILFLYGVLALVLVAFYGRSRRAIVRWMAWIYGLFAFALTTLAALTWLGERQGVLTTTERLPAAVAFEETVVSGTYLESIAARTEAWLSGGVLFVAFQGVLTLVAFLAGVLAARSGMLSAGGVTPTTLRRMLAWGLGLGLVVQTALGALWITNLQSTTPSATLDLIAVFGGFLTAPLLSAGYVGVILWVMQSRPRVPGGLAPMGRMSLTVYLSQSLVLSLIFSAWGLGLHQQVSYGGAVLIALGVTAALALCAHLWLSRVPRGPMEALLARFSTLFLTKE
ncbi:MAG: DUF418 domain-containing protein [Microcella sp.]|uniref:DUF418 domain-containing protein n=1 Tax=Microcella sp. TaxID=1913979 RepID=UPI003315BFA3